MERFFAALDGWAGAGWGVDGAAVDDCAKTHQTGAEKSTLKTANDNAKIMNNCRRYETTLLNYRYFMVGAQLAAEVRAHERNVIFGQTTQQFLVKIITAGRDRAAISLLIGSPTLVDIFLQPVV